MSCLDLRNPCKVLCIQLHLVCPTHLLPSRWTRQSGKVFVMMPDMVLSDKLIFGTGTQLIVEAKSQPIAKPSVFVMRNGTNVACLVKDFYPKDIRINLQSSKKIIEYDPAIAVSPSGKYNAVKLGQYGDSNSVKCSVEHNNEIVNSIETEQTTNSPGDLKPTEPEIQQTSESCQEPKVLARKVNMTSLTVLGLRLLFIKTVAVNFLLTAKLFFC